MSDSEFARPVKVKALPSGPVELAATDAERAALAERFDIVSVDSLAATLDLEPDDSAILARGSLAARIVQQCAISGEDLPVTIEAALSFRFVPARAHAPGEEEVELDESELDEIEFEGEMFDVGEAVAQSLGLAIDPYATGPQADQARGQAGIVSDEDQPAPGPLAAALAALKKQ